ncbi:very short patch repair endonuclease [Hyphomonas sp. NPDC076900]|uniref:very short patch repair endonuclease n=1 Tax=Hyphomonas sp. NPDC076900 TaxID=3390570 RepID=UPI003CFCE7FD
MRLPHVQRFHHSANFLSGILPVADNVSPEVRSQMMSGIRNRNTQPELLLRTALHRRGYRYRLNVQGLPGKPDMVLPKWRAIIFANGCFWHRHDCHLFRWPGTRQAFWEEKLNANASRDAHNLEQLTKAGWRVGIVWECALRGKHSRKLEDIIDQCADWIESNRMGLEVRSNE